MVKMNFSLLPFLFASEAIDGGAETKRWIWSLLTTPFNISISNAWHVCRISFLHFKAISPFNIILSQKQNDIGFYTPYDYHNDISSLAPH